MKLPGVLPDAPQTVFSQHPPRRVEGLADQGSRILQGDHEECRDEQVRIIVKGATTRIDRLRVEPRRRRLDLREEIPQFPRPGREGFGVLLHTGMDESMGVFLAGRLRPQWSHRPPGRR